MINEDDPAQQPRSLLSFQNVRTVLSLAFIDSKIPKSTLMKIEIKEVLGLFFHPKLKMIIIVNRNCE